MDIISSGNLNKESVSSAIYTIVIDDFKEKLDVATMEQFSITEEFTIKKSIFDIEVNITNGDKESEGYLGLFLCNQSNWIVRAKMEISVKVNKISKALN